MMRMKKPVILVTCVLLLSTLTVLASENTYGPAVCCFQFIEKKLSKNRVLTYRYTNKQCPKKAVIFTMKNGKEFCANPAEQWVKDIISGKLTKMNA
ncbi:monocyte chemotactic protein 1B [Labrus bergylta]|uniref:C-C motif chemokine n=1 Tax=Labrus bergylta TaxID=56723 RepID=A0A3Q3F0V8_9LABR|nr:monocyte chemotactic protein 1B-like [Labrus bergylta]